MIKRGQGKAQKGAYEGGGGGGGARAVLTSLYKGFIPHGR